MAPNIITSYQRYCTTDCAKMKLPIIALLPIMSIFYFAGGTVLTPTRCIPGELKLDKCGNLCRCFGDGVQTACTKMLCPAFQEMPQSDTGDQLFKSSAFSRSYGMLFKVTTEEKKRAHLL